MAHNLPSKHPTEVENTLGNHSMTVAPEVCDKWLAALNAQLAGME